MVKQNFADLSFSARPHVLVVDDDLRIRDLISRFLWEHNFVVMAAEDVAEARDMLSHFEFDVLVVDVMMPGETGVEFTKSLQETHNGLPVLLLTALGETEDRIAGLESGADDYLCKPFEPRELVLRLNAILRRTAKPQNTDQSFTIGRWQFDPAYNELRDGDQVLSLTISEVTLIKALGVHDGQVVSRDDLARACDVDPDTRTIDVQVARLRRKIEVDTKNPRYLQTVRGKGYILRVGDA